MGISILSHSALVGFFCEKSMFCVKVYVFVIGAIGDIINLFFGQDVGMNKMEICFQFYFCFCAVVGLRNLYKNIPIPYLS